MSRHVLIAYDITCDSRRRKVAQLLQAHLDRVQRSVFEGTLQSQARRALLTQLEAMLDAEEDALLALSLAPEARARVVRLGRQTIPRAPEDWVLPP